MIDIFVFGSNLAGRHGKGAALHARHKYGAEYGTGIGRTGNSYAIPTKDEKLNTLPIKKIQSFIEDFIEYAKDNKDLHFIVTRVGCGLAGYMDEQISPFFKDVPDNCSLPDEWKELDNGKEEGR